MPLSSAPHHDPDSTEEPETTVSLGSDPRDTELTDPNQITIDVHLSLAGHFPNPGHQQKIQRMAKERAPRGTHRIRLSAAPTIMTIQGVVTNFSRIIFEYYGRDNQQLHRGSMLARTYC